MTDQHPITPSPELVQQWVDEIYGQTECDDARDKHIAAQAARWGSDQELEACVTWMDEMGLAGSGDIEVLRAARRPKPPSLKELALEQLRSLQQCGAGHRDTDKIRRALEQLND